MIRIFIIILLAIASTHAIAQTPNEGYTNTRGVTPMHKFFQQYADSTLIIESANLADGMPSSYTLVSKTDGFVNIFNYKTNDTTWYNLSKARKDFPIQLWHQLFGKKLMYKNQAADINIFFNYVQKPADTTKKMWQQIKDLNPWQLLDDKSYPTCPPDKLHAAVVDGPYYILHLVTKKEIKTLIYYDPSFYEKEACPGNKNRQAILKIYAIFDKYFNNR
jgi:hypothetical protein